MQITWPVVKKRVEMNASCWMVSSQIPQWRRKRQQRKLQQLLEWQATANFLAVQPKTETATRAFLNEVHMETSIWRKRGIIVIHPPEHFSGRFKTVKSSELVTCAKHFNMKYKCLIKSEGFVRCRWYLLGTNTKNHQYTPLWCFGCHDVQQR